MTASPAGELAGRRILLTGGAKGLGAEVARDLSAAGAQLCITGRDSRALERACRALGASGAIVHSSSLDLTHTGSVERAVKSAAEAMGGVDALVHTAAAAAHGPLATVSWEDIQRVLATNVQGALWVTKECLPHLTAGPQSHVVFLSSLAARSQTPSAALYAASKAAVEAMAASLREELRALGVAVCVVSSSFVRPPKLPEGEATFLAAEAVAPGDVARAVRFALACAPSSCAAEIVLRTARNPWQPP
jgi:NADP-dependent 3-hydroxy acid dehydrogenase YdfG